MAFFLTGLGIALFFLAIQWYVEKLADRAESRNSKHKELDFSNARRGAVIASPSKTRITIMLDNDVLDAFRRQAESEGRGYQVAISEALREAVKQR